MKHVPFFLIIQVGLLIGWYTVAPGLPWWLVFLPAFAWGIAWTIFALVLLVALLAGGLGTRFK